MSSVTENGDVTAGKPNEEKTYKKVNKTYNLFLTFFSFHIENLSLLWVNYASEQEQTKHVPWIIWKYFTPFVKL